MLHLPSNKIQSPRGNENLEEKHLEALQIKILNNQKKAEQPIDLIDSNDLEQLIFSRYLGHKDDIPGSGQWKMIDDNQGDCWICDREIYSIIFWNRIIGTMQIRKISAADQQYLIEEVNDINHNEMPKTEDDNPLIYGQFTNWKPKRMYEIREYCDKINRDRPNILQ